MRVSLCKSYQKKFDSASLNLKVLCFCMEDEWKKIPKSIGLKISITSCFSLGKKCICILIDFFIDDSHRFDFQINVEKAHNNRVRTPSSSIAEFCVEVRNEID